jgi:hypothetical protein
MDVIALLPGSCQQMVATSQDLKQLCAHEIGTCRASKGFIPVAGATAAGRINHFDQELPMQKYLMPIVAVVALGMAAPAMAYDSGGVVSMEAAVGVATDIGLVTVSQTQFAGDEWQIEGRDMSGRYMEVDVDAATGEVLNVDR